MEELLPVMDRGKGTGETGDRRQGTGNRGEGTGDRGQETGDRGQGTGDRRQETGDRRQGTGEFQNQNNSSVSQEGWRGAPSHVSSNTVVSSMKQRVMDKMITPCDFLLGVRQFLLHCDEAAKS